MYRLTGILSRAELQAVMLAGILLRLTQLAFFLLHGRATAVWGLLWSPTCSSLWHDCSSHTSTTSFVYTGGGGADIIFMDTYNIPDRRAKCVDVARHTWDLRRFAAVNDLPIMQSLATLVWGIADSIAAALGTSADQHGVMSTSISATLKRLIQLHATLPARMKHTVPAEYLTALLQFGEYFLGYCDHAMAVLAHRGEDWWDARRWAGEVGRQVEQFDYPQYLRAPSPLHSFSHVVTLGDSTCVTYGGGKKASKANVRMHLC